MATPVFLCQIDTVGGCDLSYEAHHKIIVVWLLAIKGLTFGHQ